MAMSNELKLPVLEDVSQGLADSAHANFLDILKRQYDPWRRLRDRAEVVEPIDTRGENGRKTPGSPYAEAFYKGLLLGHNLVERAEYPIQKSALGKLTDIPEFQVDDTNPDRRAALNNAATNFLGFGAIGLASDDPNLLIIPKLESVFIEYEALNPYFEKGLGAALHAGHIALYEQQRARTENDWSAAFRDMPKDM